MSRNLCSTSCAICHAEVLLEEPPRPATATDVGPHYADRYVGALVVANAKCRACEAKYLAWVSHDFLSGGGCSRWQRQPYEGGPPFVDLSFRAAFNDEPAAADLPSLEMLQWMHEGECRLAAEECRAIAVELQRRAEEHEERIHKERSRWEFYRR